MNTIPFFSVCIPVYNGSNKIINAVKSLEKQTFKNFETIIIDDKSIDDTYIKTKKYLQESKLKYILHKNESNLGMVRNWNKTIELAKGEYIAFLHHDDEYLCHHLEEAYKVLKKYDNIGIYAVGNQIRERPIIGFIENKKYFQYIYKMKNVSPPSETIFKKKYKNHEYFYNEKYIYCPEVELYLEIANDGLKIYHSNIQTVIRGSNNNSASNNVANTWKYFIDKFSVIEKYKDHRFINKQIYCESFNFQIKRAFFIYLNSKNKNIGDPDSVFKGMKYNLLKISRYKYYKFFILKIAIDLLINLRLINIIKKLKIHKIVFFVYNFFKKSS